MEVSAIGQLGFSTLLIIPGILDYGSVLKADDNQNLQPALVSFPVNRVLC